jgi:hypothetical protein
MKSLLLAVGLAVLFLGTRAECRGGGVVPSSTPRAESAADNSATEARIIVDARAKGQSGLDALMAANQDLVARMRSGATPLSDPAAAKLRTTLDSVAKQRDAHASGLYWYTDLDAAKAEAKASGKRILSLRLLGNLDEEFSCANSRFFRTALYANKEVSDYLRQNFILHWKSVRPAPKLTIDMGDGRRIERTITGNSIHYVLAPDGFVLDAIPGLYGPDRFIDALQATDSTPEVAGIPGVMDLPLSFAASRKIASLRAALKGVAVTDENAAALAKDHGEEADAICRRWLSFALEAGAFDRAASIEYLEPRELFDRLLPVAFPSRKSLMESARIEPAPTAPDASRKPTTPPKTSKPQASASQKANPPKRKPSAQAAERQTISKSMVETPILRRSIPDEEPAATSSADPAPGRSLPDRMTPALWKKFAARFASKAMLDEASRRFMMSKLPAEAVRADERAKGDAVDELTPFARTLRNFEAAMSEDTIRNEFLFHSQIHQWLEEPVTGLALARDVEALNKKVYAELFLTPDHDAWLGLVPENVYTGLEKDGCACDAMRGK